MEKEMTVCTECRTLKDSKEFYKRLIMEGKGICKECLLKEFQCSIDNFNGNKLKALEYICSKYDLPYNPNLLKESLSEKSGLSDYFRQISSLPQYSKANYIKDKYIKNIKEINNIDFLNEDINKIKSNILNSDSPNEHGKWLNSLRDALELKNKLENNIDYSIKKVNLNKDDIIVLKFTGTDAKLNSFVYEKIKSTVGNKIIVMFNGTYMEILENK